MCTVMEILGHKDLNTTMRIYGHVVDQMKRDLGRRQEWASFLNSYEFSYQARLRAGCELT